MGKQGMALNLLFTVLIFLAALGIIFTLIFPKTTNQFSQIVRVSACSSAGLEGRCFADDTCGGKGWGNAVELNCPREQPYCCVCQDEDECYPPGTATIDFYGEVQSAEFRFQKSSKEAWSDLVTESGVSLVNEDKMLTPEGGLWRDVPFSVKYKPRENDEGFCALVLRNGDQYKAFDAVACDTGDFFSLLRGRVRYNELEDQEGKKFSCDKVEKTCKIAIEIHNAAESSALSLEEFGRTGPSQTLIHSYTLYFQRGWGFIPFI